jgi:hypothetical protein
MTRVPIIRILALRFPRSTVTGYRVDSFKQQHKLATSNFQTFRQAALALLSFRRRRPGGDGAFCQLLYR